MRMRIPVVTALMLSLGLVGCTWVEPTEEGFAVALVKESAVQNCESLGKATAKVPDNIGPIPRSDKKVREELVVLGKNEAARMGGDTAVALGNVWDGSQQFGVYRCR